MKVHELIRLLQTYDPEAEVRSERVINQIGDTAPMPLTEEDVIADDGGVLFSAEDRTWI